MEQIRPIWKSVLTGLAAAIIIDLVMSLLAAMMINKAILKEGLIPITGIVILILGSLIGSWWAGRDQKGKLLMTCSLTSAAYLLVCLLAKAAFFGNWSELKIPIMLATIGAGIIASFLPTGKASRKHKR